MDIILLNPYYSQKKQYYSFYKPSPPLSLLYLASYLRKRGLLSKIFELGIFNIEETNYYLDHIRFGLSDDKILSILENEKPKIVGITSMYSVYYRDIMDIAKLVKSYDQKIQIIVGGNHPSSYYLSILKDKNIDFVVIGEGEITLFELCQRILKGSKKFNDIKGLAFRQKEEIVVTEPREFIDNLDEIPFPAWDLIDFNKYLAVGRDNPYVLRQPVAGIISSRGCPGKCVYCTVKAVWGRTWRGRSPKNVVNEIGKLVDDYGVREIAFLDDSASVNKQRWNNICDELIRRKLNIKWITPNGIAHWTLDKPTIKKMYEAGCYRITFGIESGNKETRKFLGKPYPLTQAKRIIEYANKIGMWTICTNIIGFPYEQLKSILDTIDFAKKSGTDFALFYLLIPQPTSDVYQYFKKEGLLDFDDYFKNLEIDGELFEEINYKLNESGSDTVYFKKEELQALQKKAYKDFLIYRSLSYLINPLRILRKIRSLEDFKYFLRLMRIGLMIVLRTMNPLNLRGSDFVYNKKGWKLSSKNYEYK